MRASLRDPQLQQQLQDDGYVVVDLLDEVALADLRRFWTGIDTGSSGFTSTIHSSSVAYKSRVDEHLKAVLGPVLDPVFDRHRPLVANFVAEAPGLDSEMPEHLDWTMVDESTLVSCGVWAPLVDTGEKNGGLRVIRGSHQSVRALRGTPHFPNFHDLATISDRFDLEDRVDLGLRAGQAVIYDHRLIHYSSPNLGGVERVAINIAMAPREARTFHHHLHPDGRVERYQVDDRFYVEFDASALPVKQLSLGYVAREFACTLASPIPAESKNGATVEEQHARRATFSDPDLQAAFERDGYVKIPLVSDAELDELQKIWAQVGPVDSSGFHASMYSNDQGYKRRSGKAIQRVLWPALDPWLDDHRPFVGNFVVKAPDEQSEVGPHQDWTFVDEERYSSVTVWCPLTDTDETNGTLRVVPGSHRGLVNPRGTPINSFPFPFEALYESIMERDSLAITVRAGEAIVADNRLVHCSAPNRSEQLRVVAGCGAAPAEAELKHLYLDPSGPAEAYRVADPDFFDDLVIGERPMSLELVETFEVVGKPVTQQDMDIVLGRRLPVEPQPVEAAPSSGEPEPAFDSAAEPSLDHDILEQPVVAPAPVHVPGQNPRLRRRLWNVLSPDGRQRIRVVWRRVPGPVRSRIDPRRQPQP